MTINLQKPDITELKPRITVFGVGGGGGNAVNNMITGGLEGVDFVVANTDAQALMMSKAERVVQMGIDVTEGLGAGSQPEIGRAAAEECLTELTDHLNGTHMAFVTAGMGGGTGTGAAPVVARAAREMGVLTVGVVTKPFHFEGKRRMRIAEAGISELQKNVDTLIVIPNQNLFRIANDKTTFADAFGMADQVLYSGVACITDLMVKEGLINLDFADVRSVMNEMGKAMMGTGEASGEGRATQAAEAAISNPLLDESSMLGAQGLLISITGGRDMTLFEVDEAATRIREEVDADANIILGATFDEALEGTIRVSVVATGIDGVVAVASGELDNTAEAAALNVPAQDLGVSSPATAAKPQAAIQSEIDSSVKKIEQAARDIDPATAERTQQAAGIEKNGVRIEPFKPQSSVFSDVAAEEKFRHALEEELMPTDANFVPPAAETVKEPIEVPSMPGIHEFPPIAQAKVEVKANPTATSDERGPMGLLKKLKSGFGAAEEADLPEAAHAPLPDPGGVAPEIKTSAQPQVSSEAKTEAPANPVRNPPANEQSPYAPNKNGLDQNGRIAAAPKQSKDEDQLDIPAFLRRQAN